MLVGVGRAMTLGVLDEEEEGRSADIRDFVECRKAFACAPKRARQLVSTRSVSKSNRTNSTSAVVIHEAFLTFWSEGACAAQH